MKDEIKKFLFDIQESSNSIFEYLGDKRDFFKYNEDKMLRRAVEREFEIIGETGFLASVCIPLPTCRRSCPPSMA